MSSQPSVDGTLGVAGRNHHKPPHYLFVFVLFHRLGRGACSEAFFSMALEGEAVGVITVVMMVDGSTPTGMSVVRAGVDDPPALDFREVFDVALVSG